MFSIIITRFDPAKPAIQELVEHWQDYDALLPPFLLLQRRFQSAGIFIFIALFLLSAQTSKMLLKPKEPNPSNSPSLFSHSGRMGSHNTTTTMVIWPRIPFTQSNHQDHSDEKQVSSRIRWIFFYSLFTPGGEEATLSYEK